MRTIEDFIKNKGDHWEISREDISVWYDEIIVPIEEPENPFDKWLNAATPILENIIQSFEKGYIKYKGKVIVVLL